MLRGGVFDRELIDSWIEAKRGEVRELRARPTPYEYELYFNG